MRFYLDEDLSDAIADTGRERFDLDIVSAHLLGRKHASDEDQLRFAAAEQRCIVTRNGRDFLRLTERFMAESLPHAGVAIVPSSFDGSEYLAIARGLGYYNALFPDDVPPYMVIYLPSDPPDQLSSR